MRMHGHHRLHHPLVDTRTLRNLQVRGSRVSRERLAAETSRSPLSLPPLSMGSRNN
jgi:hypothetical protein